VSTVLQEKNDALSMLAENIVGSEIIKLAAEVNEKIKNGEKIYNLTIGDFNPKLFPIPSELKKLILDAYKEDVTNYPPADGLPELRKAVSNVLRDRCGLDYPESEILIAGGARPVIYSVFRTLVDPGDTVIFAVPSWNNNHYTYLNNAKPVVIEAGADNNFMPAAKDIAPYITEATLLALCSPQNPTGTVFTAEGLSEICDLVLTENKRRGNTQKPLYLMYDQIYWELTYGSIKHVNPVSLRPEMRNYTVFVDGISKSLAATGVRVGWSFGPKFIMDKMKAILTHIGAWAPRAEQLASAKFLENTNAYNTYIQEQRSKLEQRLRSLYVGMQQLKKEGLAIEVIEPQAAIYLTVSFPLHGKKTSANEVLHSTRDITRYLLEEAKVAIVPFYAFGATDDSSWYRLSVGTCSMDDVAGIIGNLRLALKKLN